ncbi:MAG: hypothetical protein H7836_12925 [Magnetococcus sp. YQC-3]
MDLKNINFFLLLLLSFSLVSAFTQSEQLNACSSLNLSAFDCTDFWRNFNKTINNTIYINVTQNNTIYVDRIANVSESIDYQRILWELQKCNDSVPFAVDLSSYYTKSDIDSKFIDLKSSLQPVSVASSDVVTTSSFFKDYIIYIIAFCCLVIYGFYYYKKNYSKVSSPLLRDSDIIPTTHGDTSKGLQEGSSSFR